MIPPVIHKSTGTNLLDQTRMVGGNGWRGQNGFRPLSGAKYTVIISIAADSRSQIPLGHALEGRDARLAPSDCSNLKDEVFQYRAEGHHREIAQRCAYDQEGCEQQTEGDGFGWKSSGRSGGYFLTGEKTGKNKRWNDHAKSSHHHGHRGHQVVKGSIRAKPAEVLSVVGEG